MPRRKLEALETELARSEQNLNDLLHETEAKTVLMRNIARTTLASIQRQIADTLTETVGSVNDYDFTQTHPQEHMRGVLRAAHFQNGSAFQLTTAHGFEDRVHTFLLSTKARDPFYLYSRASINLARRATASQPFETYGLTPFVEDPNNLILLGDARSLADIQARDNWPDAFTPDELYAIRRNDLFE